MPGIAPVLRMPPRCGLSGFVCGDTRLVPPMEGRVVWPTGSGPASIGKGFRALFGAAGLRCCLRQRVTQLTPQEINDS